MTDADYARGIRARSGLTQAEFAARIGVPLETVRNWEQGKRSPRGPARALLKLIDKAPDVAFDESVQGSDGAAGTIWITIQLRNTSTKTCTVKGIPTVRLLGAQGQPVTAPSKPEGQAGSLVVLRPDQTASFAAQAVSSSTNTSSHTPHTIRP